MSAVNNSVAQKFTIRSAMTSRRFYGTSFRRGLPVAKDKAFMMHREGFETYIPPPVEEGKVVSQRSVGNPPFDHPSEIERSSWVLIDEDEGSKYLGHPERGISAKNYVFLVKSPGASNEFYAYRLCDWYKFRKSPKQTLFRHSIEEIEDIMNKSGDVGEEYIEKKKQQKTELLRKKEEGEERKLKTGESTPGRVGSSSDEYEDDGAEFDDNSKGGDESEEDGADFTEKFEDDEDLFSGSDNAAGDDADEKDLFGSDLSGSENENEEEAARNRKMKQIQEKVEELAEQKEEDIDSDFSEAELDEIEKNITFIPKSNPYNFVSKSKMTRHTPISSQHVSPIMSSVNTPYDSGEEDIPAGKIPGGVSRKLKNTRKRKRSMLSMQLASKLKKIDNGREPTAYGTSGEVKEFLLTEEGIRNFIETKKNPNIKDLTRNVKPIIKKDDEKKREFMRNLKSIAAVDKKSGNLILKIN